MPRVADVKLSWKRSPSADVQRVQVEINNGGVTTTAEVGPEVEEHLIEVRASTSVSFRLAAFDSEGNQSSSVVYTFVLGDLEAPLPPTNLGHTVLGVRDAAEPPTPP